MNITCVEPLGISQEYFESIKVDFENKGHRFSYYMDRNESEQVLIDRMKDSDIVIISNIPLKQHVLEACGNLKMLSVAFTGLDHIDLEYCKQHGITVKNAAGYSTTAVSELAVGLMIDVMRKITELDLATRNGGTRNNYLGIELRGKTVGIVGTGAIGSATIKLLKAFGCNILAYSRTERQEIMALGVKYCTLDTLVAESDIISLHVPLNNETFHLIDSRLISMMKPSAILINTARGNVVDIDTLAQALKNGSIRGAGIDVFEKEPPLDTNHPLLSAPNCVVIPHIGYASREAFDIRAGIVLDNVRNFLNC